MHLEDKGWDSTTSLREVVERLYEDEQLTDGLTDQAAVLVLGWGERQIRDMVGQGADCANLSAAFREMRSLVRQANRLVVHRSSVSELAFTEQTLALVDRAMRFGLKELAALPEKCL